MPRPLIVALAGGFPAVRSSLVRELAADFPDVKFVEWKGGKLRPDSEPEPTFVFWLGPDGRFEAQSAVEFHELPVISRIDVTKASEPVEDFVRHALKSALG